MLIASVYTISSYKKPINSQSNKKLIKYNTKPIIL